MVSLMEMPQIVPQQVPRQTERPAEEPEGATIMINVDDVDFAYGSNQVLYDVSLDVSAQAVTAFIGPSGCGKTTLLRCINRMNDLVENARIIQGAIRLGGTDINAPDVDVVDLRRRVGMVFQKSNPFPKSIYENISYGLRIAGVNKRAQIDEAVEKSLRGAALWDEVKDRLDSLGTKLSGGQQQRLTIARALSHQPEILCLDEFSIAIDPVTTMRIEDVLKELRRNMTIILVTNLTQQARRLADRTMFLWNGDIIELDRSDVIFSEKPSNPKTYDYVNGIFG